MSTRPTHATESVELLPLVGEVVAREHAPAVVAPSLDLVDLDDRRRPEMTGDSVLGALPGENRDEDPDATARSLRVRRDRWGHLRASGRLRPLPDGAIAVLTVTRPPTIGPDGVPPPARGDEHDDTHRDVGDDAGDDRTAVAIVGDVEIDAYLDGRVLPHEDVDDDRVAQLARYLEVVGVESTPVCVAHRPYAEVDVATRAVLAGEPDLSFVAADGTRVTLRLVTHPDVRRTLVDAVSGAGQLYLADGHHRAAAAARFAAGALPTGRVLTAVVPSDQLGVEAFHRRIDGTQEVTDAMLMRRLRDIGLQATELGTSGSGAPPPAPPREPRRVHLAVGGRWWRVELPERHHTDPVERLDVRVVEEMLLGPLETLVAPDGGTEVVAVPAPLGLSALVAPRAIGVALHPPHLDDLLAIADTGAVMPPKTTYLTPKLPAGVLVVARPTPHDHAGPA